MASTRAHAAPRCARLLSALVLLLPLLFPLPAHGQAPEEITFDAPAVYPDTPDNRGRAEALLERAALLANRKYGTYIRIPGASAPGQTPYRLAVKAVYQEQTPVLVLTLNRRSDGREAELSLLAGSGDETPARLAAALFSLWGSFHDYMSANLKPPPLYVDELPAAAVSKSLLPGMPAVLTPMSAAVRPNGNILVGFSMLCAELSPGFRVIGQPGRTLYEEGNYSFAAAVAATPGGTVFLKPALGREIYRLPQAMPGTSRPQAWRVGIDLFGPFAALPDGSVVVVDLQNRRALRVEAGRRRQLELFRGPNSYISALSVGPEGNIWVYDAAERNIRIHSPLGELIDTIVPVMDPSLAAGVVSLSVYGDGRFVLYLAAAATRLSCFTRLGVPVWHLDTLPGPDAVAVDVAGEPLPRNAALALDSGSGAIYLADQTGRRIIKLLDAAYAADHGIDNPGPEALIDWNRRRAQDPKSPEPEAGMAMLYESEGALEMARLHWQAALDLDPRHPRAAARLAALDIALLKQNARGLHDRTLELLETLGPESARGEYSQALQLYERILSLDSSDREAAARMQELRQVFQSRESGGGSAARALEITDIRLDNLFPSLMHTYRRSPSGSVTVRNAGARNLRDLKAGIFIKRLMDFPRFAPAQPLLAPGDSAGFELAVLFNPTVLELQEDLPVQAQIEISFLSAEGPQTVRESRVLTVYRRTALVWDDSGKLSSFITPNEEIVSRFSHRVAASGDPAGGLRLPGKLLRAMRICDALGAYGIEYIEDPESPISRVLGRENHVDTVRFPRTTLLIRSGDCDDSSALLASLLESSGISTAIMTSPGHVFLAFNSEVSQDNAWLFSDDRLQVLPYRGELWLPVETTLLSEGFISAWREASRLVTAYSANNQIEFLPLDSQRDTYPPLPLPESGFTVIEPAGTEVDALHAPTLRGLETSLHRPAAAALTEQASSAAGRQKARLLNRLGILHAFFGRDEEAAQTFNGCWAEFPDYLSPAVNLANLYLSRQEIEAAQEVLKAALSRSPDSVPVNLLLAESYYRQGQYRQTALYFRKVTARAPELARNYAYLAEAGGASPGNGAGRAGSGAGGAGRGASAAPRLSLPWESE
jgi:tetratricopeptide (TPR) repeat protein